jgi:hypothetical protein
MNKTLLKQSLTTMVVVLAALAVYDKVVKPYVIDKV